MSADLRAEMLRLVASWWFTAVLALPIGVVVAVTLWAVVTAPSSTALPPVSLPVPTETSGVVPAPEAVVEVGSWQGDPTCSRDPEGDMEATDANPAADPELVAGPGDLTSVCAFYDDELAVEASMADPVARHPDSQDGAEVHASVDVDGDGSPDFSITVRRRSDGSTAQVEDVTDALLTPRCLPPSAWEDTVVRVEVDAACIDYPAGVGLRVTLRHYAPYTFTTYADSHPDLTDPALPVAR